MLFFFFWTLQSSISSLSSNIFFICGREDTPNLMSFISNLYFLPIPGLKMNIHIAHLMDFLCIIIAKLILYSCCTQCFVLLLLACIRILLITYLHISQMLLFIILDSENKISSRCSTSPDNIFLPFVPVMHHQSFLKLICNCGKFCVSLMQNRVT